eukprot:Gb_27254 [translate_table: standard]
MGDSKQVCSPSKLTVVPSKAVVPGKLHPLSNLDHMMQLHNVRLVYYYKASLDKNASDLIMEMKQSLSGVLSSYPAVPGRLQRKCDGNWEIKCCDAGVRVLEAKISMTLEKWLETADRSSELKLTHWENIGSDPCISSLLYVQFNEFEGGGVAIGFSCGHMLADPSCATLFMKAWGETHRRAQVLHPPFFHPPGLKARPRMNRITTATEYYDSTFKHAREVCGEDHVYETVTFKFSHDMVQQCMSEVQSGSHKYEAVTPFEALAALFWVSCTKAKGKSGTEESKLSICSEFRKIIIAPLPRGFFGNALHFSEARSSAGDLACNDLSFPAGLIHEDVSRLEKEELRSVIEWLENQKNKEGTLPPPFYLYGPDLTCANWEEFFSYDAIFEKEKPLHVSYYVEPMHGEGLILVLPSTEGNSSRTVMVTLPGNQTSKLCLDPSILRFSPTIWMEKKAHDWL